MDAIDKVIFLGNQLSRKILKMVMVMELVCHQGDDIFQILQNKNSRK